MKIAIIGAGVIGRERIEAIKLISSLTNNNVHISSVYDINLDALSKVKDQYNVPITNNISEFSKDKPDWIFIATPNDTVYDLIKKSFDIGANVLVEKPFGRNLIECNKIIELKPDQNKLYVGFNYRFYAGIEQAIRDTKVGKFGKLISVNLILGHGNSPGMEESWRLDPNRCGNVSTDLAVHLFDIMLQLTDHAVNVDYCRSWKGVWNTGIEEEDHFIASDSAGTIFNAQVSLNRWKSTFKLEINGTEGYGIVEQKGRSYGPQSYRVGKKWGWLAKKSQVDTEEYIINNYDGKDSFLKETISILDYNILGYHDLAKACSYKEAEKIMILLDQLDKKRVKIHIV